MPPSPKGEIVTITMLGGTRVKKGAFYVLAGEASPRTFDETRQVLEKKLQQGGIPEIQVLIYENSVHEVDPAVKALENWAKRHEIEVTISFRKGQTP